VLPPVEPNRRLAPGGNCPCCRTTVCWTTVCWTLDTTIAPGDVVTSDGGPSKILRVSGRLTGRTAGIILAEAGSFGLATDQAW